MHPRFNEAAASIAAELVLAQYEGTRLGQQGFNEAAASIAAELSLFHDVREIQRLSFNEAAASIAAEFTVL